MCLVSSNIGIVPQIFIPYRTPEGPKMYGRGFRLVWYTRRPYSVREEGRRAGDSGPIAARGFVSGGTTSGAQWWDERSEGLGGESRGAWQEYPPSAGEVILKKRPPKWIERMVSRMMF